MSYPQNTGYVNPYENQQAYAFAQAQNRPLPVPPQAQHGAYPIYSVGGGRENLMPGGYAGSQRGPSPAVGGGVPPVAGSDMLSPNSPYGGSTPTLNNVDVMSPTEEKYGPAQNRVSSPEKPLMGGPPVARPYAPGTSDASKGPPTAARRRAKPRQKTGPLTSAYRFMSGAFIADNGKDDRHIKLPHLGYLDGAKFLASWIVLNSVFFQAIITGDSFDPMHRHSPLYILRSFGLGTFFLLTLMGRSLVTPLWDVPLPPTNAQGIPIGPPVAVISWARLSRAMLVRTWRFILPVLVVAAIQWGVAANGQTAISRDVGISEPYWVMIRNFQGFVTLVFNLFTYYEWDTLAGQTFAANLWTNPWFFQGSFCAYVVHMMLGNLSSNRYWIYFVLAFFSWCTYNYFFAVILGVVFADLHAHGVLHRIRTRWPIYARLALHVLLLAIAFVFQWVNPVRDNVDSWFAVINVQQHPELSICDAVFVFCFMFVIETNGLFQALLGNVVLRAFGKVAAGMYLLSPTVMYAIIPHVAKSLSEDGTSTSTVTGVSWFVLFLITLVLAFFFHFLVELPSKLAGELFSELIESRFLYGRRVGEAMNVW